MKTVTLLEIGDHHVTDLCTFAYEEVLTVGRLNQAIHKGFPFDSPRKPDWNLARLLVGLLGEGPIHNDSPTDHIDIKVGTVVVGRLVFDTISTMPL